MAKIERNSLGYLGFEYQLRLMAQILTDKKFANSILDIVDPNYFEDPYLRVIAVTIKEAKVKELETRTQDFLHAQATSFAEIGTRGWSLRSCLA